MKTLNVIIANQEYETANHKYLWKELSSKLCGETLIMNIPADRLITKFVLKKSWRIQESKKGKIRLSDNLFLIRPLFFIRPEISPRIFNKLVANKFFESIELSIEGSLDEYEINIIAYNGKWIDILNSENNLKKNFSYYIMDEVQLTAHTSSLNKKSVFYDDLGCEISNQIFTMSSSISIKRPKYVDKMIVVGNGSNMGFNKRINIEERTKTVGFIGNFRNWIDVELLINIIKSNPHIEFGIVGPVEANMKDILDAMLIENSNLQYHGVFSKEQIHKVYSNFDVIIVPYIQNEFMYATRPIKIVESIFSGTPVITIPMSGYQESSFIKFARSLKEFNFYIDFFIQNSIDTSAEDYLEFIRLNSWEAKAELIANSIESK